MRLAPRSAPGPSAGGSQPPLAISGDADHYNHREGNDDYTQPGNLFRLMSADQKKQLIGKYRRDDENGAPRDSLRQIGHFHKADPAYGEGVAKGLGIAVKELQAALA
jgi:catalase